MYKISEELEKYINDSISEAHELLKTLCLIPAPSHYEDERAAFIKKWLLEAGAEGVYIDEAKNVVYPLGCDGKDDIAVFMAHTDTVFPMETPLEFRSDGENFYCPGVGDDTCSLVILLMTVRYIIKKGLKPSRGILFVANACEEGLGNLKGSKQIMADYAGRVTEFYTFDGKFGGMATRCVGSHRYEIECKTVGGHSWGAFGNPNAIAEISKLIAALYSVEVPVKENSKTTYNVGMIEGGTSVNTIAQFARMLYEYRSNDVECLEIMKNNMESILEKVKKEAEGRAEFSVRVVGIRPCGGKIDTELHERMIERAKEIVERHSGMPCKLGSSSTDCNAAMSVGVAAICPPLYCGGGSHTREEWVRIDSIPAGMRICAEIILELF